MTCRICGRALRDRTSLAFRIGPECRKTLTSEELAAALRDAKRRAAPGYIPPPRSPSAQARINHAAVQALTRPGDGPPLCEHDGVKGACPQCRREADPNLAAARILNDIRVQHRDDRRAERIEAVTARMLLTPRAAWRRTSAPARRRAPSPAPAPAGPVQLEIA